MSEETKSTALTVQARAELALNSSKTESDLKALAIKNVTITQVIDKAGRQQAHGAAMELRTARLEVKKLSEFTREDAVQFGKACIAVEKRLIAIIEPEENRLIGLRDAWDNEQERIKAKAEADERARITAIHERISEIRSFSALASQCRTAARVAEFLDKLQAIDMSGFEEFSEEAAAVHLATVSGVKFIHDEKVTEEAERARAKAEQEAEAAALAKAKAELAANRAELEKERAELAAAKVAALQAIEDAKPKLAPADEYEQKLEAFAAVVAPAPVVEQTIVQVPYPRPIKTDVRPTRPTDMEIVEVLALHYHVHESKVLAWLTAMDLNAVTEAIAAEFL